MPLSPRARAALDRACPERGIIFGKHDHRTALRSAALAAGLDPARAASVTSQCFRHSRITFWAGSMGHNLRGLQYLAGHKHASTTAKYVKTGYEAARDLLTEHEKFRAQEGSRARNQPVQLNGKSS